MQLMMLCNAEQRMTILCHLTLDKARALSMLSYTMFLELKIIKMSRVWYAVYAEFLFGLVFEVQLPTAEIMRTSNVLQNLRSRLAPKFKNAVLSHLSSMHTCYILSDKDSSSCLHVISMTVQGLRLGLTSFHPQLPPRGTHLYLQSHFDGF